jgi:hypothetical protein
LPRPRSTCWPLSGASETIERAPYRQKLIAGNLALDGSQFNTTASGAIAGLAIAAGLVVFGVEGALGVGAVIGACEVVKFLRGGDDRRRIGAGALDKVIRGRAPERALRPLFQRIERWQSVADRLHRQDGDRVLLQLVVDERTRGSA